MRLFHTRVCRCVLSHCLRCALANQASKCKQTQVAGWCGGESSKKVREDFCFCFASYRIITPSVLLRLCVYVLLKQGPGIKLIEIFLPFCSSKEYSSTHTHKHKLSVKASENFTRLKLGNSFQNFFSCSSDTWAKQPTCSSFGCSWWGDKLMRWQLRLEVAFFSSSLDAHHCTIVSVCVCVFVCERVACHMSGEDLARGQWFWLRASG